MNPSTLICGTFEDGIDTKELLNCNAVDDLPGPSTVTLLTPLPSVPAVDKSVGVGELSEYGQESLQTALIQLGAKEAAELLV